MNSYLMYIMFCITRQKVREAFYGPSLLYISAHQNFCHHLLLAILSEKMSLFQCSCKKISALPEARAHIKKALQCKA